VVTPPLRPLRISCAILVVAAAVALSACGGGGDEAPADPGGDSGAPRDGDVAAEDGAKGSDRGNKESRGEAKEGGQKSGGDAGDRGSKNGGGGPPAEAIEAALADFFTSGDPAVVCEGVITKGFLKQSFGDRRGCADAQSADAAARSVDVSEVKDQGKSADAVVVPKGGPNDGERLEVGLVLEGGSWRIDRIASDVPVGP